MLRSKEDAWDDKPKTKQQDEDSKVIHTRTVCKSWESIRICHPSREVIRVHHIKNTSRHSLPQPLSPTTASLEMLEERENGGCVPHTETERYLQEISQSMGSKERS